MKQYTVYYIIKANRREWLHKMEVEAANSREATKVCKERVHAKTGKNGYIQRIATVSRSAWCAGIATTGLWQKDTTGSITTKRTNR